MRVSPRLLLLAGIGQCNEHTNMTIAKLVIISTFPAFEGKSNVTPVYFINLKQYKVEKHLESDPA